MKNINTMIDIGQEISCIPNKITIAYVVQVNHVLRNELRSVLYRPNKIFISQLPKASILR